MVDGLTAQGARLRLFSDVLSAVPERVDEDRNMPSDALANLVLGKFEIIRLLRERGITVGSESVTWPFVGRICTAHSMPLGISDRPNEVPLGPFVLHGKMAYQAWSGGPQSLLAGCDNTTGWDNDRIYLWAMPLEQFASRPMTNYTRENGVYRTEFGKETFAEWNRAAGTTRVVVDGRLIACGQSSLIPKKTPGVFLAYSRTSEPQRYPRPAGWSDLSRLLLYRLSTDGEEKVDAKGIAAFEGDALVLTLQPSTPFRLCYGRDAYLADRKLRETPFPQPRITWQPDRVLASASGSVAAWDGGSAGEQGGAAPARAPRPNWMRKSTRTDPPGAALCVGCSGKFATEARAREHAASIVARKLAWQVRQGFVNRSRDYERKAGVDTGRLGFDNWNLGLDEPLELYSLERINARPGTQWYVEKVEDRSPAGHGPGGIAYRAFVAVPITRKDLHDLYVESIRRRLEEARRQLAAGQGNRGQLQSRETLWAAMLAGEQAKEE